MSLIPGDIIATRFNFGPCCASHDICYGTCGSEKRSCDAAFGACLLAKCDRAPPIVREICTAFALTFYAAVVELGDGAFCDAQSEACVCLR